MKIMCALMLDKGRIAAHGTHDELMRANDLCARLTQQLGSPVA